LYTLSHISQLSIFITANGHQQQTNFPSGTPGCSWWPWRLWQNLVPSDSESNATHCPRDGSCCILTLRQLLYHVSYSCNMSRCIVPRGSPPPWHCTSSTLRPECGDVYAPSERLVCYTLHRGSSYAVAVYPMPSAVYAILRPSATLYLSAIAIYRMPHWPIYVLHWDLVMYYISVFASDTSLAFAFTSPHQQNVKWFGSHNTMTQLFWTATPILPEDPRSSQMGWMQNDVPLRCSSTLLK